MIVIGSMELKFTKASGTFHCPQCEQERAYRHRTRRQFLTVYFIPLIPLQSLGEFLECTTCRGTFDVATAKVTAEEFQAAKRTATNELIRRVLVLIVAADNEVSGEELETVRDFARRHDQPDVTTQQVLNEAELVRRANMDAIQYVRQVAQKLTDEDKELLIHHAFLAATAAGELSESRQGLLKQLPAAIGVSEQRFREIVARAIEH